MGCRIDVKNLRRGVGRRVCQADLVIIDVSPRGEAPLVTLKECSLYEKDGDTCLGLPQRNWVDKEGKTAYVNVVELPKHTQTAAYNALLAAWQAENGGQGQEVDGFEDPFADE